LSIFRDPLAQSVKALGDFFARKIRHRLGALVHFDTGNDPLLFQRFYERAAVATLLANRFIKENYAADKVTCAVCGK
jgi:hypothetical protein